MIDQENLRYLFTEEIYVVEESDTVKEEDPPPAAVNPPATTKPVETEKPTEVNKIHEVMVWTHELTDKDRTLLSKMLAAVNLNINNIHLIHREHEYTDQFHILLSFGHTNFLADKVEKEILLNQPLNEAGKSILVSYPISSLHEDVKKKADLWNGLKKMFHA